MNSYEKKNSTLAKNTEKKILEKISEKKILENLMNFQAGKKRFFFREASASHGPIKATLPQTPRTSHHSNGTNGFEGGGFNWPP